MRAIRVTFLVVGPLASVPAWAAAGQGCAKDCRGDAACEVEVSDCLIETGQLRPAIDRLKGVIETNPNEPAYALRLARAYLADDNPFWAQRVLQNALASNPDDCEARAWLAWVHLRQGLIEESKEVLGRPGCPSTQAERGRWALLRAYSESTGEEGDPVPHLEEAAEAPEMLPEDVELLDHLRKKSDPGWISPLDLRVESMVGYTSNATAGLLVDASEPGPSSAVIRLDLIGRFVWPARGRLRPALDLGLLGYALPDEEAREFSFGQVRARPGVILGRTYPRLLIGYKADVFFFERDGSTPYFQAHRGEIEMEAERYVLYAGGGRRLIDEPGRDRTEIDGGGGWSVRLSRRVRLLLGATGRYHIASNVAYDLVGGTGLVIFRGNAPKGFSGQLTLSGGMDHYPSSRGYGSFFTPPSDDKRRDALWGVSAVLWAPPWGGVRLGLVYDYARRDSNAETEAIGETPARDYDFQEHRAMLRARWTMSLNPFAPRARRPDGHVGLDYGLGAADLADERMREMLQQDDADRRSSCGCGG